MPLPRVDTQPDAPAGWNELAKERGSFYHRSEWIDGLRATFDFPVHYLSVGGESGIASAMAAAEVPALFGPSRLVSLPFSYAAGPIANDDGARAALYAAAADLARTRGLRRVEIKTVASDGAPPSGFARATRYSTYRVPTERGEGAIWKTLHGSSTQRNIRKGEKSGIIVARGSDADAWTTMAQLEERTAHGHGVPAPPRRFFVELCASLQRRALADLYLATLPDGSVGAGIVVWKGNREWIYAFGASRPETLALRPNHVLLWAAMRDAAAAGVAFDLGRAAPEQHGLVEFKTRWGGVPVPLAYDYWPGAAGLNVARRDRGPLALASRVWSVLPRAVARRGSALYRYLG